MFIIKSTLRKGHISNWKGKGTVIKGHGTFGEDDSTFGKGLILKYKVLLVKIQSTFSKNTKYF